MRLTYIDYIKAFAISLVIILHSQYFPFESLFFKSMYSMCVPLFFMVNGYLMLRKEHSISDMLRKNAKLLVVLFCWAILATSETMIWKGEWANGFARGGKTLILNAMHISMNYCGHLWFLRTLFFLNILNPILYYFIHYNKRGMYYLIVILFLCTTRFFDIIIGKFYNPLYGWDWYPVLYYVLGYALLDGHLRTEKLKAWHVGIAVVVLLLMQWGYNWVFLNGPLAELNLSHGWIPTNEVVWFGYWSPIIVLATAGVCLFFQKIEWKENAFWSYVGRNSLPIYLMQSTVISLLNHTPVYQSIIGFYYPLRIILPIATLLLCMGLTWLLQTNKYTKYFITI